MPFTLPPLYPILDSLYFPGEPVARAAYLHDTVQALADAGITLLQLRAKQAETEQLLRDAEAVRLAAPAHLLLILNDRADLLGQTGFRGVHLGQGDLPVEAARTRCGPAAILGLSTHTVSQVEQGDRTAADYLASGPVFATSSKPDAEPAIGLAGLRAARAATDKPLVAIGGITLANAQAVWAAGADSIAVISAVFAGGKQGSSNSPGRMAEDFLKLFR